VVANAADHADETARKKDIAGAKFAAARWASSRQVLVQAACRVVDFLVSFAMFHLRSSPCVGRVLLPEGISGPAPSAGPDCFTASFLPIARPAASPR